MTRLRNNKDENGVDWPLIGEDFFRTCEKYAGEIENELVHNRDYLIDYFGFKTLYNSYLMKINSVPVERIQHMWMRVALFLNQTNLGRAIETYHLLSQKIYTHATPTLFHAGMIYPQLISCFLLSMEDSIDGIFSTLNQCAQISKWAGGIGVHISNIRSYGSKIRKTNGTSSGIIPMLGIFNKTAEYVNQAGRRKGSFAFYLEPHHPDILDFLELKLKTGAEEKRARSLFYGLWISDYFMTCVSENKEWYLLDPDRCPGLNDAYGEEYEKLYKDYVNKCKFEKKIKARDIWYAMIRSQIEKGVPYVCFKDAINQKSNQKHYGTIKSSNLCVTGDTQILTQNGYFPIESLENQKVKVWNGEQFSETIVRKTRRKSVSFRNNNF
jgi:ribonucleoside-diphosphate reductase alpha chain